MSVPAPKRVKVKNTTVPGLSPAKWKPWTSQLTPNQVHLAISLVLVGRHDVEIAVQANTTTEKVRQVRAEYRHQIDALMEQDEKGRDSTMGSMYEQMLKRWESAGKDPNYQPEEPVNHKPPSTVHKPSRSTGKGVYKAFTEGI